MVKSRPGRYLGPRPWSWPLQCLIPRLLVYPTAHEVAITQFSLRHYTTRRSYSTRADTSESKGPLHGIKVLDFSRILAAPFCSQILADYGADVIKIEQPGQGDETRSWRTNEETKLWKTQEPISLYFAAINRNKRSLTLDLKKQEARDIVYHLMESSDIVIENFVPGKANELGIGYKTLSEKNPRVVYASLSGYGPSGPYAGRAGYDAIAAAEGGLMHITGHRDGAPVRPGLGMTDMATGLYAHGAIMAALLARQQTGLGQHISASLFETQISLLINIGSNWLNMQKEGQRFGAAHPSIVPYNTWKCKDGTYLALAANNQRQFQVLCKRIGRPEMVNDARFATNALRVEHRTAMDTVLDDVFSSKTIDQWLEVFDGSGLAHGPVNTIERAFAHPQIEARDMVQTMSWDALVSGQMKAIGMPVKFSETPGGIKRHPPSLGEHTDEILAEIGYDEQRIRDLKDVGVV